MHRTISAFLAAAALAAVAAVPVNNAWAATHASARVMKTADSKLKKYKGPFVDMRWGPVRATITIKGKKLKSIGIATSPENFRSQLIDGQAVPLLKQETLQAQSANIDTVSGATMTSEAYIESLQAAITKAHFKTPQS